MPRHLLAALCSLSLVGTAAAQARRPMPSPDRVPTLIVFITVDQLRADYFDRFKGQLTSGLGRLARGGAMFTNAFQDHPVTETAPGHASTMSGRFPRSTGIARGVPASLAGRKWEPLLDNAGYPEPDKVPVENGGKDFPFPHALPADPAQ